MARGNLSETQRLLAEAMPLTSIEIEGGDLLYEAQLHFRRAQKKWTRLIEKVPANAVVHRGQLVATSRASALQFLAPDNDP